MLAGLRENEQRLQDKQPRFQWNSNPRHYYIKGHDTCFKQRGHCQRQKHYSDDVMYFCLYTTSWCLPSASQEPQRYTNLNDIVQETTSLMNAAVMIIACLFINCSEYLLKLNHDVGRVAISLRVQDRAIADFCRRMLIVSTALQTNFVFLLNSPVSINSCA